MHAFQVVPQQIHPALSTVGADSEHDERSVAGSAPNSKVSRLKPALTASNVDIESESGVSFPQPADIDTKVVVEERILAGGDQDQEASEANLDDDFELALNAESASKAVEVEGPAIVVGPVSPALSRRRKDSARIKHEATVLLNDLMMAQLQSTRMATESSVARMQRIDDDLMAATSLEDLERISTQIRQLEQEEDETVSSFCHKFVADVTAKVQ